MIDIRELNMIYAAGSGAAVPALDGISLEVPRGQFVSLVGPSGCGKSTLLKIVAGLYRPSSGAVSISGKQVLGPSREIGMVFQGPVLLPWRTVLQNVLLPAQVRHLDLATARERAFFLLAMMGLKEFQDRYPQELSGGMQQRVSIARALIHDPSILLMDEPFAALDAMTREALNLELLRIWNESRKTVVFVTHSIVEAVFLSSRVVIMSCRPGRVLETIEVKLPMPRTLAVMGSPEFGRFTSYIRSQLQGSGSELAAAQRAARAVAS